MPALGPSISAASAPEASAPALTAVICTHNRERYLGLAIDSLLAQTLPAEAFEILVVDNASQDGTAALVARSGPRVRYVHEPRLGLSIARNAGLAQAHAPLVAYLDDDAIATSGWVAALIAACAHGNDDVGCVGGRVRPIWEAPRPAWLDDELVVLLSMLDYGDQPRRLPRDTHIVGANMAFRAEALRRIGGFPESLGRRGANLLSREETYVRERLDDAGYACLYWPDAEVAHHASADRLTAAWFRRRLFWQGISRALSNVHERRIGALGRLSRCVYNASRAAVNDGRRLPLLPFWSSERRRRWRIQRSMEWGNALGYLRR